MLPLITRVRAAVDDPSPVAELMPTEMTSRDRHFGIGVGITKRIGNGRRGYHVHDADVMGEGEKVQEGSVVGDMEEKN